MADSIQKKTRKLPLVDLCAVLFLAVCIFLLGLGSLSDGCFWGDDFAAYILQGIAIADGTFDEQMSLNYMMHPSFMPDEAADGKLVYVWGYSLIMALVYKLVGFDRVAFSSIVYYKLPSVIALALLAAVLYLFLRRRFGFKLSFFLSLLFCTCGEFFTFFDYMYSDLVFLFFALLAIYLCELFLDASGSKRLVLAFFTGLGLWFMYEVRLNGVAVVFACALAHFIWLIKHKNELKLILKGKNRLITELLPYILFIVLKLVSEAILAPATSNASDLKWASLGLIAGNIINYSFMVKDWFGSMWSNIISALLNLGYTPRRYETLFYAQEVLAYFSFLMCIVGIIFDGIKKNFHYTAFLGVYLFVASMLFYNQGLRYIYPMLPVLLMFSGYGFMRLVRLIPSPVKLKKALQPAAILLLAFLSFCMIYPQHLKNMTIQSKEGADAGFASVEQSILNNAYSSSAIEAYDYINANVSKDSVIGFFKPRALYLNTQCRSITLSSFLGHSTDEVDYYLVYNHMVIDPVPGKEFVTVWENADFILMERQPD